VREKIVVVDANAFWTEQLFRECGRFADVLLLKPRDFRAHRAKYGTLRSDQSPREIRSGVWEQRISMLPGWMFWLWPLSERRLARTARQFAQSDPLILVITFPQYRGLFRAAAPARTVYYNLDDYRDNWPRFREAVPKWEAKTVDAADLTICIAGHRVRMLRDRHSQKAASVHHLPLGVTPEFMEPFLAKSQPRANSRRTAGYIGALNYRFDFAFLAEVARRMPEVTFTLGGSVGEDGDAAWRAGLADARKQPNITFLGWITHEKLPEHLAQFDVLLIPYSHCNFNTNACPAKLWDYFGTGKPIVANDTNPETLLWRGDVRIGATPAEFAHQVQDAIDERGAEKRERRLAIAKDHTWARLGERLEHVLMHNRP
jgi:hypothetical protein